MVHSLSILDLWFAYQDMTVTHNCTYKLLSGSQQLKIVPSEPAELTTLKGSGNEGNNGQHLQLDLEVKQYTAATVFPI